MVLRSGEVIRGALPDASIPFFAVSGQVVGVSASPLEQIHWPDPMARTQKLQYGSGCGHKVDKRPDHYLYQSRRGDRPYRL